MNRKWLVIVGLVNRDLSTQIGNLATRAVGTKNLQYPELQNPTTTSQRTQGDSYLPNEPCRLRSYQNETNQQVYFECRICIAQPMETTGSDVTTLGLTHPKKWSFVLWQRTGKLGGTLQ